MGRGKRLLGLPPEATACVPAAGCLAATRLGRAAVCQRKLSPAMARPIPNPLPCLSPTPTRCRRACTPASATGPRRHREHDCRRAGAAAAAAVVEVSTCAILWKVW